MLGIKITIRKDSERKKSLALSKQIIVAVLMSILFVGCAADKKSSNPVMQALYQFSEFAPTAATRAIVIIADNSCIPCNKELASLMANYLTKPEILFIISAHESAIDLSPYINASRKDIVFDYNHSLTDNQVIKGSTVLFLKSQEVDTAITIDATQLDTQIAYLKQRLK